MSDLAKIVEDLSKLTVLEAAELAKMLEEKWGVSAAAAVAVAAAPAGAAAAPVEEQTEFTVILKSGGDKKINVIKEVRAITGLASRKPRTSSRPATRLSRKASRRTTPPRSRSSSKSRARLSSSSKPLLFFPWRGLAPWGGDGPRRFSGGSRVGLQPAKRPSGEPFKWFVWQHGMATCAGPRAKPATCGRRPKSELMKGRHVPACKPLAR